MAQEEVLHASGDASTSHQQVPEREELVDCKCRCRVDASLKKTSPTKETETEANQFEEFSESVKHWQTEKFIYMIDKEPQLMLKPFEWNSEDAKYTVFQLAVLTNSEKLVAEMLDIASRKFGRERQQLLDKFKLYDEEEDISVDISVLEVAEVMGNRCIAKLLHRYEDRTSPPGRFHESCSPPILEEELLLLDLIRSILNKDVEEAFSEFSSPELKESPVEEESKKWVAVNKGKTVRDSLDIPSWWGRRYGIKLGARDDLYVLHYLASELWLQEEILQAVLELICGTLRGKLLARLLNFTDDAGLTPLHILGTPEFIRVVRDYCEPDFDILNVRDLSGGTLLHRAAAIGFAEYIESMSQIDGFKRILDAKDTRIQTYTALHLAVMNNELDAVKVLVKQGCDINNISSMLRFEGSHGIILSPLTAFQMAAMDGRLSILRTFLEDDKLLDFGMINTKQLPSSSVNVLEDTAKVPALHLAAVSGSPLTVKALLDCGKINPLAIDKHGNTALHYAAGWQLLAERDGHLVNLELYARTKTNIREDKDLAALQKRSLGGIIGCMDLLIQAGLDMEKQNNAGETPQLGPSAGNDLIQWWYDKLVRQTQEAKTNFVAAANAISVTAALVATASYVGPLQPPLGLSTSAEEWLTGYSQVNHTAIQVFLFCNSLSFYLAIASIMLATIPSLTIPQEALPLEVRIANRVVQGAIVLLFASITTVICAFSAASISVVPESRWHYKSLTVVSIILGGFVCSAALCLFLIRLMRLMKPSSKRVLQLNKTFFPFRKVKKQSDSKTQSKLPFSLNACCKSLQQMGSKIWSKFPFSLQTGEGANRRASQIANRKKRQRANRRKSKAASEPDSKSENEHADSELE